MEIKTLAEILAENNLATPFSGSNKTTDKKRTKPIKSTKLDTRKQKKLNPDENHKIRSSEKQLSVQTVDKSQHESMSEVESKQKNLVASHDSRAKKVEPRLQTPQKALKKHSTLDNISAQLKAQLKTPDERQAEVNEIKANSRLRWLAFYYLSVREHSAEELKRKLLAKDQDPQKIDELLTEFAEKGYQSEVRTALMLIREGIRKGRGRRRIKQDLFKRHVNLPANIDELIDMANEDCDEFVEYSDDHSDEGVNWLRQAVQARVKKYGAEIPQEAKDKAKQLRFLQYRGFQSDICFEAIKYNVTSLEDN